jgi:serine/threonine protein kinase
LEFLERFGYVAIDPRLGQINITEEGVRVAGGERAGQVMVEAESHLLQDRTGSPSQNDPTSVRAIVRHASASTQRRGLVDGYQKLRSVGAGGIGTVYLAKQLALDREVALKEIRELFGFFDASQRSEIKRRFRDEVAQASRLAHPNIAMIVDANTDREYPYVVSEFVAGGNLRRLLERSEVFPPSLALEVFIQLLQAVAHAHERKVVHRGIKPENVLFDLSGNARVTDFGLARVVQRDQSVIRHIHVGVGSIAYMAPELFANPNAAGVASDLYALGILLYEMLARRLPGRRSPMPSELHPVLPGAVDTLFDRLTQDAPEDRYSSVDEALEELHRAELGREFNKGNAVVFHRRQFAAFGPSETRPSTIDELIEEDDLDQAIQPAGMTDPGSAAAAITGMTTTESEPRSDSGDGDPVEEGDESEGDEDGDPPRSRRRGRGSRPYSFLQRRRKSDP